MLDIGLEIRILRERLKISAKELAGKIGLSQSQMSRLEKGQRRIDTRILARIAEALEVDPSHFFRGGEAPEGAIPPSDPGGLGKRVRSERRKRHLSAEELANRAGTTKATLVSIEEGKRELEPDLAERITKALRLPGNFFLGLQQERIRRLESQIVRLNQALTEEHRGLVAGGDGATEVRGIPVLGTLVGGYPHTFDETGEPTAETDEFVFIPGIEDPRVFAVHVIGDSMESPAGPSFAEGDLALFARGATRSRDLAFVRLKEDPPIFRQTFFDPASRVRLQPLNLNYPSLSYSREEVLGMWRLVAHVARY